MRLVFFLCLLLAGAGCRPSPAGDESSEAALLLERTRDLACRREALRREVAGLWDSVSDTLSAHLPPTMAAEERRNMIEIRNADLIRMFKVYPALDTGIHGLIDRAEARDRNLAARIRDLEAGQEEHDAAVQAFLQKLEGESPEAAQHWRDRRREALQAGCDSSN